MPPKLSLSANLQYIIVLVDVLVLTEREGSLLCLQTWFEGSLLSQHIGLSNLPTVFLIFTTASSISNGSF